MLGFAGAGLLFYIFIIFIFIVVNYFISKKMESIAEDKGYTNSHAFVLCFFLGIAGYLYVIALPDLVAREQMKKLLLLTEQRNSANNG